MKWSKAVVIALDQLINALCGGWPDETLSSRAYRRCRDDGKCTCKKVIDTLFFFEKDHCFQSYVSEEVNRHLPPEFRDKS